MHAGCFGMVKPAHSTQTCCSTLTYQLGVLFMTAALLWRMQGRVCAVPRHLQGSTGRKPQRVPGSVEEVRSWLWAHLMSRLLLRCNDAAFTAR